jgi:hypothetical protein
LLEGDTLPAYAAPGSACSRPSGIAERRLATLNAEIARLTELRNRLAAQLTGPARPPEAANHRQPATGNRPTKWQPANGNCGMLLWSVKRLVQDLLPVSPGFSGGSESCRARGRCTA